MGEGFIAKHSVNQLTTLYTESVTNNNCPDLTKEVGSGVSHGNTLPTEIKVYANLLDQRAAVRTWYAIRAIDQRGSGWAYINVKKFAKWLDISASTVYSHLADADLFPIVNRGKNGYIRVFYTALVKVAYSCGIESAGDLGACTEFLPQWLGDRMLCAAYATELQAQAGQRQAYFKAEKAGKKRSDGSTRYDYITDPAIAVKQLSKQEKRITRGLRRSKVSLGLNTEPASKAFRFYRIRNNQATPGISQEAIARSMKRSRQTIQNRLRNTNRVRWGAAPLNRRRVVREFTPDVEKRVGEYLDHMGTNFAAIKLEDSFISHVGRIKIGEEKARPYQLLTNIYEFNFQLVPGKRNRSKLNRLAQRRKTQCPTLAG